MCVCMCVCVHVGSREYLAIRKPRRGPWEKRSVSKHGPRRKQPRAQETEQTVSLTPDPLSRRTLPVHWPFMRTLWTTGVFFPPPPSREHPVDSLFSRAFFPPSFSLSLTPPPSPHSFFCPRSFRRFWEARWLGDEKKSLVFFADLLLSRMLMSSFDVLFCPLFFPPFFFFVGVTVSNGSLNFLNMRSLFIYRYLIYRWKYINSNSDAILFSFFFSFPPRKYITNDSQNLKIAILFFGRIFYKRYFCANAQCNL